MHWRPSPVAEPLDEEALAELVEEDLGDLVFLLDGVPYNEEDLYVCDGCDLRFTDRSELDEDCLCEGCAEEAEEARRDLEDLRRWYRSAVL